jgi:hypothetical protein
MPSTKALTVAERKKLAKQCYDLRLSGALSVDVEQFFNQEGADLTVEQLQEVVAEADDMLLSATSALQKAETDQQKALWMSYHLAARHSILARCLSVSDYRSALACLQDLAKLQGLYPQEVKADAASRPVQINITEIIIPEREPIHAVDQTLSEAKSLR